MYGAQAKRVPARGGGGISDVNIFKVGLIGDFERGIAQIQRDIFDYDEFENRQGGRDLTKYAAYVAKCLYDEIDPDISIELITRGYVATDAVQAVGVINDNAGAPVKIFDIKAGFRNLVDKSAFGNKIAYKIENSENRTYTLTSNIAIGATSSILNNVEDLEIGYILKYADGTNTEGVIITAINKATKTITHAATTNAFTVALTTISRLDWTLRIAVRDNNGIYQEKEVYSEIPFVKSDVLGMPLLTNNTTTGSYFVILAVNAANATSALLQRPAPVTNWTALASGADGTPAVDSDYNALQSSMDNTDIFFMLSPESSSITHNQNFADYATTGDKWFYYSQGASAASSASLQALGQALRKSVSFAMMPSDKWIKVEDGFGGTIAVPKVGYDVAHWYNVYIQTDEEKVAAGNKWPMKTSNVLDTSNGLIHDDKAGVGQRMIEKHSINICKFQSGVGITNNSARTFSTDGGYMFQNQIAMSLIIRRSILQYFRTIEQDKSGAKAQEQHRNAVYSYLKKKYDANMFFRGVRPDGKKTGFNDVVKIINDFSNNPLADIANGIEVTFVQFVATPPIEKPTLELASASVTTI